MLHFCVAHLPSANPLNSEGYRVAYPIVVYSNIHLPFPGLPINQSFGSLSDLDMQHGILTSDYRRYLLLCWPRSILEHFYTNSNLSDKQFDWSTEKIHHRWQIFTLFSVLEEEKWPTIMRNRLQYFVLLWKLILSHTPALSTTRTKAHLTLQGLQLIKSFSN